MRGSATRSRITASTWPPPQGDSHHLAAVHVGISLLTLVPGQVGGSETYVRGLLRRLALDPSAAPASSAEDRYTVLASPGAAPTLEQYDNGPVQVRSLDRYRPGSNSLARLAAMLKARYLGRRLSRAAASEAGRPLDLVHYPLTVAIPRLACPAVVTALDIQHELMPELFSSTERAYRRLFYATAIDRAAAVITISEFCKDTIVERHDVEADRVFVSHLAVDRELFSASGSDDEELLAGLSLPERFVVYPANLWPHKNHERLLDAVGMLGDEDLHLLLTGQQYGRWETLRGLAARLGVERRVRHLGYVPRDLVPALYRAAEGVVFPSLFEGFGLPPLEALSCGCPIAVAERGSLPEVVGEHAITFDPTSSQAIAHAIDVLLERGRPTPDPGREFWERYSWERLAGVHRTAYATVAQTIGS
jgi:glycosyltransferase involved in cell wall biosynthesis